jgi:hypothetical protein
VSDKVIISYEEPEMLPAAQAALVHEDRLCADCLKALEEGPRGGECVNWYCTSPTCGSKFNDMGVFGVHRI